MGRQIRCVPRLSQPHGAERRAAHDALRPLRMRVPRRVGGVVHRGGLSGGNAVPRISSLGTVEGARPAVQETRSEEHTSELQSQSNLVCRLLLEKKKTPSNRGFGGAELP